MSHFALPSDCTIGCVAELKAALAVELAAAAPSMTVNAGSVERCDASLLQVLVALQRALATASGTLSVEHASGIVRDTAAALGMSDVLRAHHEPAESSRP